jgi:hypothetical protein
MVLRLIQHLPVLLMVVAACSIHLYETPYGVGQINRPFRNRYWALCFGVTRLHDSLPHKRRQGSYEIREDEHTRRETRHANCRAPMEHQFRLLAGHSMSWDHGIIAAGISSDGYPQRQAMELPRRAKTGLSTPEIIVVVIVVTLMTGSPLGKSSHTFEQVIKASGYVIILWLSARLFLPLMTNLRSEALRFSLSYAGTIAIPYVLYFAGLILGAFAGTHPGQSLWQTTSDALVFCFALLAFGWANGDLPGSIRRLLAVIALWSMVLLFFAITQYAGNRLGWWLINPYYYPMGGKQVLLPNGPFDHANHLGYALMSGALAAFSLGMAAFQKTKPEWICVGILLSIGLIATLARGAVLGLLIGMIGITAIQHRLLAFVLGLVASLTVAVLALYYFGGSVSILSATPAVTSIPAENFQGYRGMSGQQWSSWLKQFHGNIRLNQNGSITSQPIWLSEGSYQVVLQGHGTLGSSSPHEIPRTPFVIVTVLQEGNPVLQEAIRLPELTAYLETSKWTLTGKGEISVVIAYEDDAHTSEDNRNVILEAVYVIKPWVPLLAPRTPSFLPKVATTNRGVIWATAIENLRGYGPLGAGAGQAESRPGLSTHNFWLEQYGEGGVLTILGVLGWLILPLLSIRQSALPRRLAWAIVAMMAAVLVHGLFWTQFLNGLRYLTLVMSSLWTALSTLKPRAPLPPEI